MKLSLAFVGIALVGAGAIACGSTSNGTGTPNGGTPDSGAPPPDDAGAPDPGDTAPPPDYGSPSTTFPAFPPNFGQLANNQGYVMKSPVVVAITWNGDTAQATFDGFADTLGGTAYWKAVTSEYGVGPATSGATNHVHMTTAAPAQLQDSDIQALVTANAGKTAGWPAATQDTIYAFFLPPSTSLLVQGLPGSGAQDACKTGVGGYHDEVVVGSTTTSYAVVPSCTFGGANTPTQQSTMSMSHELAEAATDPEPKTSPGYTGFDADHFSFEYFQELQAENGDACEFFRSAFYEDKETTPAAFDFWVQRTWSNASANAAHDPCVPAVPGVYFNVTPLALEKVNATIPGILTGAGAQKQPTKGVHVPAGQSVTFPVGFYSDGPTNGPWTISVESGNPVLNSSGRGSLIDQYNGSSLTATLDKTSGQNGEKAYVTVSVKTGGSLFKGEIVTVTSKLNGVSHYMPVWVSNE